MGKTRPVLVFERRGVSLITPALEIHLVPRQMQDFVAAPAGVVRKIQHVLIGGRRLGADLQVLVVFKEPVPRGVLFQSVWKERHAFQETPPD